MSRTVTSVHNDWLSLVEPVGAFLTLPVLKKAWPNGIPPVDRELRADVRLRVESLSGDVSVRTGFLQWVLRELLGYEGRLRESAGVPPTLTSEFAVHRTTLRPDFALMEPGIDRPGRARLLVFRWPLRTPLNQRPARDEHGLPTQWAATPVERAATACRAVNVPLALVTDTDRFALVWAPRNAPGGHAVWPSSLFGEERLLLDSFVALLGMQRFFGVAENQTLEALLTESGSAQAEVTDRLGHQVREAVELLVSAMSRAHRSSGLMLLRGVSPQQVYSAAVTVMMRLVVLLAAEERRLLPADDPLYAESYSVAALREQLEALGRRDGFETLEKRHTGWHRLLATFRALHGGIEHDRLRLPAYGGSLFDPARYPFLERPVPLPVDDHTTLEILNALLILSFRHGGLTEARRLSYLNLDVEQIGHVYEGLLDHGCRRVDDDIVLGLTGKRGEEPELGLSVLEAQLARGDEAFGEWFREHGGPQPARTRKLLYEQLEPDASHRLMAACDNDEAVYSRVLPIAGLLREDLRRLPMVILPGALYVTKTSERRDSGTAYTTKELADEVVRYALEPLVYAPGPADGAAPRDWKLKSSSEILSLKVCDPAVGSGAILVAACRYLADRLVEAWEEEGATGGRTPAESLLPGTDWTLEARRRVTDHCLYGIDRNPMAIEMAKLSLWLTTMARERPFTFLDHQVRCGDSLIGISSLDQVRWFHIDPARGAELHAKHPLFDPTRAIDPLVEQALAKTRALDAMDANTIRDVETQQRLHREMLEVLDPLVVVADAVAGAALATPAPGYRPPWVQEDEDPLTTDDLLNGVADDVQVALTSQDAGARHEALTNLREKAEFWLDTDRPEGAPDRICLHWPLAFPEVLLSTSRCGFDAFVGNPPYLGGTRISGPLGVAYRHYLSRFIAGTKTDRADLVVFFILRSFHLLRDSGVLGLLATDKITQTGSKVVGLDTIVSEGGVIFRGTSTSPWPGNAVVSFVQVWIHRGNWHGRFWLDNNVVSGISTSLGIKTAEDRDPYRLVANAGLAYVGSKPGSPVFLVERDTLLALDDRYAEVVRPYLTGDNLNNNQDASPSRYVIDFSRTSRDRLGEFQAVLEELRSRILRRGENLSARWWEFQRSAKELYVAIESHESVLAIAETSRTLVPLRIPNRSTYSNSVIVFTRNDDCFYGFLSSTVHKEWAWHVCATLPSGAPRYIPNTAVATFPLPACDRMAESNVAEIMSELHRVRADVLTTNGQSLTPLYALINSREAEANVEQVRALHVRLDYAVAAAYEWQDLNLDHGVHQTKQGLRFTVCAAAREEILRRLLRLNHDRHAAESEKRRRSGDRESETDEKKARTVRRKRSASSAGLFRS
jgi:hypothetical protein